MNIVDMRRLAALQKWTCMRCKNLINPEFTVVYHTETQHPAFTNKAAVCVQCQRPSLPYFANMNFTPPLRMSARRDGAGTFPSTCATPVWIQTRVTCQRSVDNENLHTEAT